MNMFKYSAGKNASTKKKILLPVFLFLVVAYSIGYYAYMIGKPLHEIGLTYVMLSLFIFMVSIITIIEGIYKSQGILLNVKIMTCYFHYQLKEVKYYLLEYLN